MNAKRAEMMVYARQLMGTLAEIWVRPTMPGSPVWPLRIVRTLDRDDYDGCTWEERADPHKVASEVLFSVRGIVAGLSRPRGLGIEISGVVRFCARTPTERRYTAVLIFVGEWMIVVPAEPRAEGNEDGQEKERGRTGWGRRRRRSRVRAEDPARDRRG